MAPVHDSGVPWHVKAVCLLTVTSLTTALVILMRLSKTEGSEPYASSTAVLISEIIKLFVSLIALGVERKSLLALSKCVFREILCDPKETCKLMIPAGLYALQNNLVYLALTNLDAATYQITYQLKILTTALFAVILLKKRITRRQWFSLVILTTGVALVQLRTVDFSSEGSPNTRNQIIGFTCILINIFTSGISGVYFEYLVKVGSVEKTSVPLRNSQLGIFSVAITASIVLLHDGDFVAEYGFFAGYTPLVWSVPIVMAVSGLSVAVTLKYADNILKGFATSISIILTAILSHFWLSDLEINLRFVAGTMLVLWATFEYGLPSTDPKILPKAEKSIP
ncbi:unnamed protein product [Notodromas monacha]|uniref:UDP-N-acetylglucosamine transporter n=1 Tax=Notodromas monacha TaxID=399045 RepID=A0A7R9C200_9CRUS|nr:unnamed protein product [Notodromas monacha]CAG0924348.1 unnamed protein product [Notodromas monacha]